MKKQSLKEMAYDYIKNKIVTCEYLPNAMINEGMICRAINSSRTPVREAISKLEQENLLKIIPKKGIIVKDITLHDVKHIYETRLLIEPYAIKEYGAQFDVDYLRQLKRDFNDQGKRDILNQDEIDDKFHQYIVSQTNNVYLINTLNSIYVHNTRVRIISGKKLATRIGQSIEEHTAILDRLLEEDYDGAATALIKHLELGREMAYRCLTDINISI